MNWRNSIFSGARLPQIFNIAVLSIALALTLPTSASAHQDDFWLGKWQNTPRTLKWKYLGDHRYLGNAYQGATNWNDSVSSLTLAQWSSGTNHIELYDVWEPNETYWARAWTDPSPQNSSYTYGRIKFNPSTVDSLSDFMRTKVATHEFGHVFGLSHTPGSYSSNAIMKQGILNYNDVQYHDWQDFAAKY